MKLPIIGLFVTGLIAAICVSFLVSSMRADARASQTQATQEIKVLIATRPIEALTVIDADSVEVKLVPVDSKPEGAIMDAVGVVGRILTVPMIKGQVFSAANFVSEGQGFHVATGLKTGMRAVAISLDTHSGMEALLYPGSVVDVLASFRLRSSESGGEALSTTLLQSVTVLAVGRLTVGVSAEARPELAKTATVKQVTLMVTPRQAEALQLAMQHGTIALSMRNPLDNEDLDQEATMLNGGRLAQLAAFMEKTVDDGPGNPEDGEEDAQKVNTLGVGSSVPAPTIPTTPTDPVADLRKFLPSAPSHWEATIIRGTAIETRKLELKSETPENELQKELPPKTVVND